RECDELKATKQELLEGMARVMVVVLSVYALWKLQDLRLNHHLGLAFQLTPEAVMFWGELGVGTLLPAGMLAVTRVRRDQHLRFFAAVLAVLGLIMGRLNVAVTGMMRSSGVDYFPAWQEFAVTLMRVAAGFAAFAFAVKYLDLFPKHEMVGARPPALTPAFGLRGMPTANTLVVGTLWVLVAIGAGLLVLADSREARSRGSEPTQEVVLARPVATTMKVSPPYAFALGQGSPGVVTFTHESHLDYADDGCKTCHRRDFSLRRAGQAHSGAVTMARMEKGELCGRCHNDSMAFGVTDHCDRCHK
ncbi:MAG: c(7)-type cytochrome triheme domain-containing protein, partial [Myxococcota bacterium]